jgi:hypothetical protein
MLELVRVDLGTRYVTVSVLQEEVGGNFQQYFYNRYKIVVYTGLRSDCMLPDTGNDDVKKQRNAEYAKHINDPVLSSLKMEGIRLLSSFFLELLVRQKSESGSKVTLS